MKKKFLEAGRIVNTHGVHGEVKIQPWANDAEFLLQFDRLFLDEKPVEIRSAFVHKNCLIAKLAGIDSVEDAMKLKNRVLFIDREDAELEEDEFFIQDIIGATVVADTGETLGTLSEALDLPQGYVYVVKGEREILIPAVEDFILSTDVENGTITVHLLEGM